MSQSHTKDQPKASDVNPNKEQRPSMGSMFDASMSSVQTKEYDASTSTWGDADYDMCRGLVRLMLDRQDLVPVLPKVEFAVTVW